MTEPASTRFGAERIRRTAAALGVGMAALVLGGGIATAQTPMSGTLPLTPPFGPRNGGPPANGVAPGGGVVRSAMAALTIKVAVLQDVGAFDDPVPPAMLVIRQVIDVDGGLPEAERRLTVLSARMNGSRNDLRVEGLLTPHLDVALAPFTPTETDAVLGRDAGAVDPQPYLVAIDELLRIQVADDIAGPNGSVPISVADGADGIIDVPELIEGLRGVDIARFRTEPEQGAAAPTGNAADRPGGAAAPEGLDGPPVSPLAFVVAGGAVVAFGGGAALLFTRRRRRDRTPGVDSAVLVGAAGDLAALSRLPDLRRGVSERFALLVDAPGAGWFDLDADGRIRGEGVDPAVHDLVARAVREAPTAVVTVLERPPVARIADPDDPEDRDVLDGVDGSDLQPAAVPGPHAALAVAVVRGDEPTCVLLATRPSSRPFGEPDRRTAEHLVPIVVSALANVERLESLEELALVDSLTGLPNRRAFDVELADQLRAAADGGSQLGMVMVDVDHFKSVNDRFGHAVGDVVLRRTADTLAGHDGGGRAYRIGGEEFCILLPVDAAGSVDGVRLVAEELRRRIEALEFADAVPDGTLHVTSSFGIALAAGEPASDVLRRADDALYEAKRSGRNRVVLAP